MRFPESVPARNFPDYEALNDGSIRNRKTGRIIKTHTDDKGFKKTSLRKDNKRHTVKVARVVADSFYEGDHSKFDIGYRDGDKDNTSPDNLIFRTRSESARSSFETGRAWLADRKKVRVVETGEVFRSIRACAIAFGGERYRFHIGNCLDDPNRTFKGYHFEEYIRR
jgi:hypothetical protein